MKSLAEFANVWPRAGEKSIVVFCMNCGDIIGADNHHADCPTRKGLVWKDGKWRRAERRSAVQYK